MTWRSFMDYWLMRELDQADAIARNYILTHPKAYEGYSFVYSAVRRMGLEVVKGNWHWAIHEVQRRLEAMGYDNPNFNLVRQRVEEWFTWDRIRKGDLTVGRYLSRTDPHEKRPLDGLEGVSLLDTSQIRLSLLLGPFLPNLAGFREALGRDYGVCPWR